MRLVGIELSGFRAFAGTQRFDLDADAVIVVGANGQGKTSLFDGVLWALTGVVLRLGKDANLVSMYSSSGTARVQLELRHPHGTSMTVVRSFDGKQELVRVELDGAVFQGDAARVKLLETLWPEALVTADAKAALSAAMSRSVYLQQDLVREFIEADSDQERFTAVSELVGAGRVTELQVQLDNQRTAWTRAINNITKDVETARQRLDRLQSQLFSLGATGEVPTGEVETAWNAWWEDARRIGVNISTVPTVAAPDASSALDQGMKLLQALLRSNDRRRDLAADLLSEIGRPTGATEAEDESPMRAALEAALQDQSIAREALLEAEARTAEMRRTQVQLRETRQELQALADLALRHLGDHCPICAQTYDRDETRHRLERLLTDPNRPEDDVAHAADTDVTAAAGRLERAEQVRAAAQAKVRQAEQEAGARRAAFAEREARIRELGIELDSVGTEAEPLRLHTERLSDLSRVIAAHLTAGEQLALRLAEEGARARRAELERELVAARLEAQRLERDRVARQRTGEVVGQMLAALREAASDVVAAQLERVEPLLQRIYASIDPHPSFRAVRILTRFANRRGRVVTALDDLLTELSTEAPATMLSSSQMNALAVAVFLTFSVGLPTRPLSAAILDDPLQSMDDINLLGLIDLLRHTKDRHQLLVSTHDARFGRLLGRKLRPVREGQRTLVIELDGWSRQGPTVVHRDLPHDVAQLRLVG